MNIDELLARALLVQPEPEIEAEYWRDFDARFEAKTHAILDAENVVICANCHMKRPRQSPEESYYYPADQCVNVRNPWHYHRVWTSWAADQRERRRHKRRLRKGRVHRVPAPSPS